MSKEKQSLYELTAELVPLEQALEAAGGDVTDQDALVARLSDLLGKVRDKVDGFGSYYTYLKAMVDRITKRRQVLVNRMERLRLAAKTSMEMRGIEKVEGDVFTVSLGNPGGRAQIRLKVPENKIPKKYIRKEIDMDRLGDDLAANNPDALAIAEFEPRGKIVRIA